MIEHDDSYKGFTNAEIAMAGTAARATLEQATTQRARLLALAKKWEREGKQWCHGGEPPSVSKVRLAYEQCARELREALGR